jgi:hypothetical protein
MCNRLSGIFAVHAESTQNENARGVEHNTCKQTQNGLMNKIRDIVDHVQVAAQQRYSEEGRIPNRVGGGL